MSYSDPQGLKVGLEISESGSEVPGDHPDRAVVKMAFSGLTIGATAQTETVATAGTAIELAGANLTAGEVLEAEADASTGRLTAQSKGIYEVEATGEVIGENNAVTQVSLAQDGGSEIASTLRTNTMPATAAYAPFHLKHRLELEKNEYVSLWVDSDTNSDDVSVRALSFTMTKIKDETAFHK